jgi:trk system potassium uptake protein
VRQDGAVYIVVIGAGEVGSYVAERLSKEGHDVAVVESDPGRLAELEHRLDVLTVLGSGSHPDVLDAAGVSKADVVVAVSSNDEVNLITSWLAKKAGAFQTVARLQAPELRGRDSRDLRASMGVDLVIDPAEEAAKDIIELIEFPGAAEVEILAGGEVIVLGARLPDDAPAVGRSLGEIALSYEPEWGFLFGSITRGDTTVIPRGDFRLEAHDLVRVVCNRRARRELAELLGLRRRAPKRVMLLGGGRTAELVAERIGGRGVDTAIVESDIVRARQLAERLSKVTVLQGDINDVDLLENAGIGEYELVVALSGEDDANVLACLLAKREGSKETIAVVHRLELLPLLDAVGIDVALSPRTASANAVIRLVRGGTAAVATFLLGEVEVLEFTVQRGSAADGGRVADLDLPHDVLIGAYVREGTAQIGRGSSRLAERDKVVVFAMPRSVEAARRVFE